MRISLTITPRYMTDRPFVICVPDSIEDLEGYLRDFVFDNIIQANFKVVKR